MNSMKWNGTEIPIKIVSYKNSRHIRIWVKQDHIKITKPKFCSVRTAMNFMREQEEVLYQQYQAQRKGISHKKDTILYLGEEKKLEITISPNEKEQVILQKESIIVNTKKMENSTNLLRDFYAQQLFTFIEKRIKKDAKQIGATYHQVKIKYMTSRYGSYSMKTRNIHVSSIVMMCPEYVIDAILIHELCHSIECNHSSKFYNLVYQHCPLYTQAKEWLRVHQKQLIIE